MRKTSLYSGALFCVFGCTVLCSLTAQAIGSQEAGSKAPQETPASTTASVAQSEDWTVLHVNPSDLQPMSYAVIATTERPEYSSELLRIQWRVADPIDLYVVKPHGVKNPPVVLYLYGYPSDTDRFRDDGWCKRTTQGGFAAIGFVSALTGQRYANRPMKDWFVSELQESLGASVHDVEMILNYLQRRGDLDVSQVGMFGQGSGGAIAALVAQADPRISVLDLLNPWGDWPDWLKYSPQVPEEERAAYLTPEFLKRVENLDPILYLPKLKLKGLRVQQVMDEPVTPSVAKAKIAGAVQPPERLVQYKDMLAQRDAWRVSGLSGWLHDQMRPPQPSQSAESRQTVTPTISGQNESPSPKLQAVQ